MNQTLLSLVRVSEVETKRVLRLVLQKTQYNRDSFKTIKFLDYGAQQYLLKQNLLTPATNLSTRLF